MKKFEKCDVTYSWTPSPCHKLSHLLRPPSSVTYFMDGPETINTKPGKSSLH